jgi:hypothetical protein
MTDSPRRFIVLVWYKSSWRNWKFEEAHEGPEYCYTAVWS